MMMQYYTDQEIENRRSRYRTASSGGSFLGHPDRRRDERVPFYCEVRLTAQVERTSVIAHTCDLGMGGVKLVSPVTLSAGSVVMLAFVLTDRFGHKAIEHVIGRVAWCKCDHESKFLGVEFASSLQEEANPLLSRRLLEL
jgi:PilZ domain-containing protein